MKNTNITPLLLFWLAFTTIKSLNLQAKMKVEANANSNLSSKTNIQTALATNLNQVIVPRMRTISLTNQSNSTEDSTNLKKAMIVEPKEDELENKNKTKENFIDQRPNYLSNVIYNKATSTVLKNNNNSNLTFDLDHLKKSALLDNIERSNSGQNISFKTNYSETNARTSIPNGSFLDKSVMTKNHMMPALTIKNNINNAPFDPYRNISLLKNQQVQSMDNNVGLERNLSNYNIDSMNIPANTMNSLGIPILSRANQQQILPNLINQNPPPSSSTISNLHNNSPLIPPINVKLNPIPIPIPEIQLNPVIAQPFAHVNNLTVKYVGSMKDLDLSKPNVELTDIVKATENISQLNSKQIKDILNFLKIKKNLIKEGQASMVSQARKYSDESRLILDNVKTEVIQTNKEFDSIYKPLVGDPKVKTINQLKEEYMHTLTGYHSERSKYKLAQGIDPEDLSKFNTNLKSSLGQNKDFYLYGDRNFLQ
mmetsp:Transcript_21802/g.22713  ORF Transcript_21802/g.22713 Transcript_21802/m.22713 type:complete len:482 (+) Transcript_21802:16-1461(+)